MHTEPDPVACGQAGQRLVHAGQMSGPVAGVGQAHARQQGADAQLPPAYPGGQHGLDPRCGTGGVDDLLQGRQRDHRRAPPSSLTACASAAGSRLASEIAQALGAADPGCCHERRQAGQFRAVGRSHVARSREVSSRGRPVPPSSAADQRVRQVPAARIGAAADQPLPGGPGRRQQRRVVAGQHRHGARPGTAHL